MRLLINAYLAVLLPLASADCIRPPRVSAEPAPAGLVSQEGLPKLLEQLGVSKAKVNVAMLGVNPSRELADRGNVSIDRAYTSSEYIASPGDTRAILWILSAIPNAKIACVPLPEAATGKDTGPAITRALSHAPVALYVPASALITRNVEDANNLQRAINEGWAQNVLLFSLVDSGTTEQLPVGILPIYLVDLTKSSVLPTKDNGPSVGAFEHVALPTALFSADEAGPCNEGKWALEAGYMLAVFGAMSTSTPAGHLERTALVTLTAMPTKNFDGSTGRWCMVQPRAALGPPNVEFFFAGHTFHWDDRIGQNLGFTAWRSTDTQSLVKPEAIVVAGVNGEVPLRWLAAVSVLTQASPVFLLSQSVQSVVAFRSAHSRIAPSDANSVKTLLLTMKRSDVNPYGLFNVVTDE